MGRGPWRCFGSGVGQRLALGRSRSWLRQRGRCAGRGRVSVPDSSPGGAGWDPTASPIRFALALDPVASHRAVEAQGRDYVPEHAWADDMESSGLFNHVRTTVHPFTRTLSASDFVEVSNTYGPNSQLTTKQRDELGRAVRALIDTEHEGVIEKTEEAVLIVARKVDG